MAVVDPGVGTDRAIVYARIGQQQFIAPDNGLLSRLAARTPPQKLIRLSEPAYWLEHGLDDVPRPRHHGPGGGAAGAGARSRAARPAAGAADDARLARGPARPASRIDGAVIEIDSFGNLITNITADMLAGRPTDRRACIVCNIYETWGIYHAYAEQPSGTLVALIGSSGRLELALVGDNAAAAAGHRRRLAGDAGVGVRESHLQGKTRQKELDMARPVTMFTGQWADLPLAELARKCSAIGYDGLELACWGDHFEVDKALEPGRLLRQETRAAGKEQPAGVRHQRPPGRPGGAGQHRRPAQGHPAAVRLGQRQSGGGQRPGRRGTEEHRPGRPEAGRGRGQRLHRLEHLARCSIPSRPSRRR